MDDFPILLWVGHDLTGDNDLCVKLVAVPLRAPCANFVQREKNYQQCSTQERNDDQARSSQADQVHIGKERKKQQDA
jgi:uncharacterized membrane protein